MPLILKVRPDELRPIERIGAVAAPLFIASGTADAYTPITEAEDLFSHAPRAKTFWAVEGAAHVDLERYGPTEYWSHILPFLTSCLRRA
jgi:fermentation-respiration switch protein FrsA (DUF1100 family)